MATRRTSTGASSTSSTSSTSPTSSTYKSAFDKECEKKFEEIDGRLDALESKSHTPCGGGNKSDSKVEERLEALITFLKKEQNIPL